MSFSILSNIKCLKNVRERWNLSAMLNSKQNTTKTLPDRHKEYFQEQPNTRHLHRGQS